MNPYLGGIPIVPWKQAPLTAADISDATAAGRAMLTAADEDAQAALLKGAIRIANADLAGVTGYSPAAWAAGRYSRLWYRLSETTVDGAAQVKVALTGLSASYVANQLYQESAAWAVQPFANATTTAWAAGTTSNGGSIIGEISFRPGFVRQFWSREIISAGTISQSKFEGFNTDTSHDVTNISFDWGAVLLTGHIEIWGWP